jgi:hypothetical protein
VANRNPDPKEPGRRGPLSDLQETWESLREMVEDARTFQGRDQLLALIDEATCWESVRDLARMRTAFLLVQGHVAKDKVPKAVKDWLQDVVQAFKDLDAAIAAGQKI